MFAVCDANEAADHALIAKQRAVGENDREHDADEFSGTWPSLKGALLIDTPLVVGAVLLHCTV